MSEHEHCPGCDVQNGTYVDIDTLKRQRDALELAAANAIGWISQGDGDLAIKTLRAAIRECGE